MGSGARQEQNVKAQFVNELAAGARVSAPFVLRAKEVRVSPTSGAYALYTLSDRTGQIQAIQFDVRRVAALPPLGTVVNVAGVVDGSRRVKRVKVSSLAAAERYEPGDFIASVARPVEEMSAEFGALVRSIGDAQIRATVSTVFHTGDTYERFMRAPLSTVGFGACLGGALAQALRVAGLAEALAENHEGLCRDVLIAGALLKFVGCVDAFWLDADICETQRGKSLGVDVLSLYRLHDTRQRIAKDKQARLESVVVGSAAFPEAALLQMCVEMENMAGAFAEHDRYRRMAAGVSNTVQLSSHRVAHPVRSSYYPGEPLDAVQGLARPTRKDVYEHSESRVAAG
jgi:hypothetical protein